MAKEYLDKRGLTEVANHVNTRLKSVNLMPTTADEFAVRLYIGENNGIYKKGHIYQMQKTSTKKLKFSAGTTTYFADEDGTVVSTAPTSYTDVTTDVPTVNPDTGGTIIYMAGSNALVQRISDGINPDIINSITINFARIEASTMPWWIVGSETGSYNPQAVRDVTLIALTEWVDITPFQKVMLDTPLTIDGNVEYTVEEALSGLNDAIINLPVPIVPKASITFENLPNLRGVFSKITPAGDEDPAEEGWYEINAQKVFVLTIDTVVEAGKDYYEKTADSPVQLGWMYNITDEFTTTGDFVEGYGVPIGPDHNIVAVDYDGQLKWDVFGGQVSTATTEKAGIVKPDGDTINLQLDGGISVSGEYKKIFEGTEEAFLDLPVAERKKYDEIHSPDKLDESQITDSITDGNMKAVTSNAVFDAVSALSSGKVPVAFEVLPNNDCNNAHLPGFHVYKWSDNEASHTPMDGSNGAMLTFNYPTSGSYVKTWQQCFTLGDRIYFRDGVSSDNGATYTWKDWQELTNNLKYRVCVTDSDLNDIKASGAYSIYISDATSQATNHAPTYGWLQLIVIQMNNSLSFCNQVLYSADGKMFMRECGNNNWSDWKQIGNDLTSGTITIPAQTLENGAHAEIQIPLTPGDFYCGRIDFADLPAQNMSLSYNDFSGSFQDTRSTDQRTQYVLYPIGKANLATLHVYLTNYTGSPVTISDVPVIYYLEHHRAQ